jgi:hypothetical protein
MITFYIATLGLIINKYNQLHVMYSNSFYRFGIYGGYDGVTIIQSTTLKVNKWPKYNEFSNIK